MTTNVSFALHGVTFDVDYNFTPGALATLTDPPEDDEVELLSIRLVDSPVNLLPLIGEYSTLVEAFLEVIFDSRN
jgi:hypothetical protein